jgi:glutathione S-transferase
MREEQDGRFTLYGDSLSGNCLKTKWTAQRLSLDHNWVEVSVTSGATRTDAFLRMNPQGQVPVMQLSDGRILPQSNAIILYLAEMAGSSLVPADTFARAQMMSWLFWEQYSHEPYIAVRRFRKAFLKQSDDEIDPQLLIRGHGALRVMEQHLAMSAYLTGDGLTLADIALVAYTRLAGEGGFDLSGYRHVVRWIWQVESDLCIEHAALTT